MNRAPRTTRRLAVLALAGALTTGLLAAPADVAAEAAAPRAATLVKRLSDGFSGKALDGRWTVKVGPGEAGKSLANYIAEAVQPGRGKLSITTVRRCDSITGPIRKKCANPVYTSGRIDSRWMALPTGDFRVAFRVKLPAKPAQGTRWALWLKNDQNYCANGAGPTQGEIDVLEYYGRDGYRNKSYGVSHLSCNGTKAYQDSNRTTFTRAGYHIWSMERRGGTLTYRVDSKVVGRTVCGEPPTKNVSKALCDRIFEQTKWSFIIQGEVFAAGKKKMAPPDPSSGFPAQVMLVDWMRVYKL